MCVKWNVVRSYIGPVWSSSLARFNGQVFHDVVIAMLVNLTEPELTCEQVLLPRFKLAKLELAPLACQPCLIRILTTKLLSFHAWAIACNVQNSHPLAPRPYKPKKLMT